ncbi:MAG: GatB/YqeY domain-containing protein, partial [Gemmatimonadaceae bacterium]
MSLLMDRVAADLASARKAQNKPATLVLGTILSEIKNRAIELRRDATEEEVVEVVQRSIKKRRESIEFYTKGGREELASNE